jgi:uncharacterized membrane protein
MMTDLNLADWLPGVQAMANLHPLVVHFPIALLVSFWLAAALALAFRSQSLHQAASWMLYFGTAAAAVAVAAGFQAAETVDHSEEVHVILERHATLGVSVLGLSVFLSAVRWLNGRWKLRGVSVLELVAGLVLVGALSAGADLGALMVYGHAVGVRTSCPEPDTTPPVLSRPNSPGVDDTSGARRESPNPVDRPPAAGSHEHSHHHHHHHGSSH